MKRTNAHWRIDLIHRGLQLRARGLGYGAIAVVLDEYHDFKVTEAAVRSKLRAHGAPGVWRGKGMGEVRRRSLA